MCLPPGVSGVNKFNRAGLCLWLMRWPRGVMVYYSVLRLSVQNIAIFINLYVNTTDGLSVLTVETSTMLKEARVAVYPSVKQSAQAR